MKTVIVFFSFTSNNRRVAQYLAEQTNATLVEVHERNTRRKVSILLDMIFKRRPVINPISVPEDTDHLIFVTPLWDANLAYPMQSALRQIRRQVQDLARRQMPMVSLVTLCGGERSGQAEKVQRQFEVLSGQVPTHYLEMHVSDVVEPGNKVTMKSSNYAVSEGEFAHYAQHIDCWLASVG